MKSSKVKNELGPTHPGKVLREESLELVADNPGMPVGMVRQILQGREERISGQATEYKFG